MTQEEIKLMLKDIIDNGAEYECTIKDFAGDYSWIKYKLGDEIHSNWKYRKVEKWCVTTNMECFELDYLKSYETPVFIGKKEECEKWIEEHSKKTWLEELNSKISPNAKSLDFKVKETATEVCKKILEEVEHNVEVSSETTEGFVIGRKQLKDIIENLGVRIC